MHMVTCLRYAGSMSPHRETREELEREWLRLIDLDAPQAELDAVLVRLDHCERASA